MIPQPGDIVTVINASVVLQCCRVYKDAATALADGQRWGGSWVTQKFFGHSREGVEWCRGESGEAVDALVVAQALR